MHGWNRETFWFWSRQADQVGKSYESAKGKAYLCAESLSLATQHMVRKCGVWFWSLFAYTMQCWCEKVSKNLCSIRLKFDGKHERFLFWFSQCSPWNISLWSISNLQLILFATNKSDRRIQRSIRMSSIYYDYLFPISTWYLTLCELHFFHVWCLSLIVLDSFPENVYISFFPLSRMLTVPSRNGSLYLTFSISKLLGIIKPVYLTLFLYVKFGATSVLHIYLLFCF